MFKTLLVMSMQPTKIFSAASMLLALVSRQLPDSFYRDMSQAIRSMHAIAMKYLVRVCPAIVALTFSFFVPDASAQDAHELTDDLGRAVVVPVVSERIISGSDLGISTILIEMNAPIVGSMTRLDPQTGRPYMMGPSYAFGATLESEDIAIASVGRHVDFEAVAALAPDLIIANQFAEPVLEQVEQIAPTFIVLDTPDPWVTYESVARVLGRSAYAAQRRALFEQRLFAAREMLSLPDETTYAIFDLSRDGLYVGDRPSVTYIAEGLGLVPNDLMQAMREDNLFGGPVSLERFQEIDADYVFFPFEERGLWPFDAEMQEFERLFPGWCDLLTACREGRVIFFSSEIAFSPSFVGYSAMLEIAMSNILTHRLAER